MISYFNKLTFRKIWMLFSWFPMLSDVVKICVHPFLSFLLLSLSLSLLYILLLDLLTFFGLLTYHSFSIFNFISFSKGLCSSPCLTYVNISILFSCNCLYCSKCCKIIFFFLFKTAYQIKRLWWVGYIEIWEMQTKFWLESLKERDQLEGLGINVGLY